MDWIGLESTAFTVVFVSSFLCLAIWESWRPFRELRQQTAARWSRHGILFAGGVALQAIVLRVSPLVLAASVAGSSWGLLNRSWQPAPLRLLGAILLLDLLHYTTHRLFHSVGLLWRVHEVHHSDEDYDVSTAARFHPLEVLFGKTLYLAAVAVLAPPLAAVFFSEVLTSLLNLVAHANVAFPPAMEKALRWVFVTPPHHRLHHSINPEEQNRNFGQTFTFWDRLLGTYRERPAAPEDDFSTGLAGLPPERYQQPLDLFAAPFQARSEIEKAG